MVSIGISKNVTMLCASLMGKSIEQMVKGMHQAKAEGADLVEIRLDCVENFHPKQDLQILLNQKPLPVIVVYRPLWEGGQYEGDERSRLEALVFAKELGADYIDLELTVASDLIKEQKRNQQSSCKFMVSCNVDGIASSKEDLSHLVERMQSTGADVIKVISNSTDISDTAKFFKLLPHCQVPLIAYSMGDRGLISQLLGPKFGSALVYGSIEGYPLPGLPTLKSLTQTYHVKNIGADTAIFGLISKPISYTRSPNLHNHTLRHVGYNGIYVPMLVDDLKEFFSVYSSPDFAGFSVGLPYKETSITFCDEVHPFAQSIGAINTIIRRPSDGKLIGYNTDCEASVTAIEDGLRAKECTDGEATLPSPLTQKSLVLVGAGGAGRALAFGAKSRGARILIFDLDFDRAKSLAHAVSGEARPIADLVNFQPEKGAILANATPLGLYPNTDRIPVAKETFRNYKLVFDVVYTPPKSPLLTEAEAAGAIIVSGVEMFLRQAIAQFNLFTGGKAPEEFMRKIVQDIVMNKL